MCACVRVLMHKKLRFESWTKLAYESVMCDMVGEQQGNQRKGNIIVRHCHLGKAS